MRRVVSSSRQGASRRIGGSAEVQSCAGSAWVVVVLGDGAVRTAKPSLVLTRNAGWRYQFGRENCPILAQFGCSKVADSRIGSETSHPGEPDQHPRAGTSRALPLGGVTSGGTCRSRIAYYRTLQGPGFMWCSERWAGMSCYQHTAAPVDLRLGGSCREAQSQSHGATAAAPTRRGSRDAGRSHGAGRSDAAPVDRRGARAA